MDLNNSCIRVYADTELINNCKEDLKSITLQVKSASELYSLLGNETRLKLLYTLHSRNQMCVCDLSDVLDISIPAVSQQLKKLSEGGLVRKKRVAQTIFYFLDEKCVDYLDRFIDHNNHEAAKV